MTGDHAHHFGNTNVEAQLLADAVEKITTVSERIALFEPRPNGTVVDRTGNFTATMVGDTAYDAGLAPEPAVTLDGTGDYVTTTAGTRRNYCTEPRGPAANWDNFGTNTQADTTEQEYAEHAIKVTYQDDLRLAAANVATLPDALWWFSFWVYIPSDWDGGELLFSTDGVYVGATNTISTDYQTTGQRDQWVRIRSQWDPAADFDGSIFVRAASAPTAGKHVYIAAGMAEASSAADAPDYFDGTGYVNAADEWVPSDGVWCGWLGTAHASASDYGIFANGTVRTFVVLAAEDDAGNEAIIGGTGLTWLGPVNATTFRNGLGGSDVDWTITWPYATPNLVALEMDEPGDTTELWLNGISQTSKAKTGQYAAGEGLVIGTRGGGGGLPFDGLIGSVAVIAASLTADEHEFLGHRGVDAGGHEIGQGEMAVQSFATPSDEEQRIVRVSAYLDGKGSGGGTQNARAVIFDDGGNLAGLSQEIAITANAEPGWVDFDLLTDYSSGVPITPGTAHIGVWGGVLGDSIRLLTVGAGGGGIASYAYGGHTGAAWSGTPHGSASTFGARTNLCTNPSLEVDTTDWSNTPNWGNGGATISSSADGAVYGSKSLKVVTPGTLTSEGCQYGVGGNAGTSGQTYTATAWVKVPIGVDVRFLIGEASVGATTVVHAGTGEWTQLTVTRTWASSDNFLVNAHIHAATTATTFYVDGLLIENAASALPYFDGDGLQALPTPVSSDSFAIFAQITSPRAWAEAGLSDEDIARLPWTEAQRLFGGVYAPTESESLRRLSVGWHGTATDGEADAFAVVPLGDPNDLLGDRIKVSHLGRAVVVYVHEEADIIEDVSLTRRAYARLAPLATEDLITDVEIAK